MAERDWWGGGGDGVGQRPGGPGQGEVLAGGAEVEAVSAAKTGISRAGAQEGVCVCVAYMCFVHMGAGGPGGLGPRCS